MDSGSPDLSALHPPLPHHSLGTSLLCAISAFHHFVFFRSLLCMKVVDTLLEAPIPQKNSQVYSCRFRVVYR